MKRFKIEVYIPVSSLETFVNYIINNDLSHTGNYSCCLSYTLVKSMWKSGPNSSPYIGEPNKLSKEEEYKLEFYALENEVKKIICDLRNMHPYETACINVFEIIELDHNLCLDDK